MAKFDPHRIETPEPIATKFGIVGNVDYAAREPAKPNLVQVNNLDEI